MGGYATGTHQHYGASVGPAHHIVGHQHHLQYAASADHAYHVGAGAPPPRSQYQQQSAAGGGVSLPKKRKRKTSDTAKSAGISGTGTGATEISANKADSAELTAEQKIIREGSDAFGEWLKSFDTAREEKRKFVALAESACTQLLLQAAASVVLPQINQTGSTEVIVPGGTLPVAPPTRAGVLEAGGDDDDLDSRLSFFSAGSDGNSPRASAAEAPGPSPSGGGELFGKQASPLLQRGASVEGGTSSRKSSPPSRFAVEAAAQMFEVRRGGSRSCDLDIPSADLDLSFICKSPFVAEEDKERIKHLAEELLATKFGAAAVRLRTDNPAKSSSTAQDNNVHHESTTLSVTFTDAMFQREVFSKTQRNLLNSLTLRAATRGRAATEEEIINKVERKRATTLDPDVDIERRFSSFEYNHRRHGRALRRGRSCPPTLYGKQGPPLPSVVGGEPPSSTTTRNSTNSSAGGFYLSEAYRRDAVPIVIVDIIFEEDPEKRPETSPTVHTKMVEGLLTPRANRTAEIEFMAETRRLARVLKYWRYRRNLPSPDAGGLPSLFWVFFAVVGSASAAAKSQTKEKSNVVKKTPSLLEKMIFTFEQLEKFFFELLKVEV